MARRNILNEIERERGIPLNFIVLPLVNQGGQQLAAKELGVSQATISKWLEENGYVSRTIWQKDATPEEKAQIEAAGQRVDALLAGEGAS